MSSWTGEDLAAWEDKKRSWRNYNYLVYSLYKWSMQERGFDKQINDAHVATMLVGIPKAPCPTMEEKIEWIQRLRK